MQDQAALIRGGLISVNEARALMPLQNYRHRMDGTTWMVSVIHSTETEDGSQWYSERAGQNPIEAAVSYCMDDPDDNPGARLCRKDPDMVLLIVIGQQLAVSLKPWKVYIFQITDWPDVSYPPTLAPFQ